MRRSVDERITIILVDTCAFRDANSDFIGISSMLLPSFFSVIKEKDMLLLTHPILEKEIEKHIEDSGIYKDYQSLVSHINKCKDVLRYANCCDEELFSKIAGYNIKTRVYNFINTHIVFESTLLRLFLQPLILLHFRYFLRNGHKIPVPAFSDSVQNGIPVHFPF
uniref:hypothetical protein n=1 Tax=Agathobacter sp. TaxID=2021311 RepID=UPI00405696D5